MDGSSYFKYVVCCLGYVEFERFFIHDKEEEVQKVRFISLRKEIKSEVTIGLGYIPKKYKHLFQGIRKVKKLDNDDKFIWLCTIWSLRDMYFMKK